MKYSPESLVAFVESAAQGSLSAAARKLKKSQSTISISIANLEADIGCELFDRSGRQPVLNDAGQLVLGYVQAILTASDKLDALAVRLSSATEPLVTVVMTDMYSVSFHGEMIARFEGSFPFTELRCGPSEDADVIQFVQTGQANIGILAAQPVYPADIVVARLPRQSEFGVYVGADHALATCAKVHAGQLETERQLYIKTYAPSIKRSNGQAWSAPDYLNLIEFASRGFGWAELPRAMVEKFGKGLVELKIAGYPRRVDVDIVWSRHTPPGPAGQWLVQQLLEEPGPD